VRNWLEQAHAGARQAPKDRVQRERRREQACCWIAADDLSRAWVGVEHHDSELVGGELGHERLDRDPRYVL
jgi:hypothetical protein